MREGIAHKLLRAHLVSGDLVPGTEIGITIDQTLTHDVTGTQAYLAFETLGVPETRAEKSVSYIDHNLLYIDNKNFDDHVYLQSIARKYGLYLSRAGNGICHTVHFERFGVPGRTLLGADSHTPTGGAIGMLAIGAGGLDVAMAMAGEPFFLTAPNVVNVRLRGRLRGGVSAKDIILELLRRVSVRGGLGKILEYSGGGLACLDVFERSTIANMGAETGATTSVFPSDDVVREFFEAQGRLADWMEFLPDRDAEYDETIDIDLSSLEPLVAKPDMPDNVVRASELREVKVNQVFIGSCTNASYRDIAKAAMILEGRVVHPEVSLSVAPGSRQIFAMLLRDGVISKLVASGARILESGCGPCVGIGQAPNTGGVSLRTSNRNFRGRAGTLDASIYLSSPEVAAATAVAGYICDPRTVIDPKRLEGVGRPLNFVVDDRMIISPRGSDPSVQVVRGPNIKAMPLNEPLRSVLRATVVAKFGDNITTDDIIPANAQFSALRSNIPAISEIVFGRIDPEFHRRAKECVESIVVAGRNYGQGSSREHAAIAPMYLGVKAVLAVSMARIHKSNLVNHGVLPLLFKNPADYDAISQGDVLSIDGAPSQLRGGEVVIVDETSGRRIPAVPELSKRETEIVIGGGRLRMAQAKRLVESRGLAKGDRAR